MKAAFISILTLVILLSACSVQKIKHEAKTLEDEGYLKLNGDLQNRVVMLNGQALSTELGQRFALKSGTYDLLVSEAGQPILKRTVFITSGQTVELSIP